VSHSFSVEFRHRVIFTRGLLTPENPALIEALRGGSNRLVAFIDAGFADAHPDIEARLAAKLLAAPDAPRLTACHIVPGGEQCKNNRTLVDAVVAAAEEHHLCRRSWVLAIGGGAVLDAVGYGAAISHRGVRLVRVPTTVLAQDDAGMGVKNGINRFNKKNFEGTFAVPWAVLNDADFLTTLPDRFWRGGFSEAVKIALLKDASFFDEIEGKANAVRERDMAAALPIIERCAQLHLEHIVRGGDAFELAQARPLDYGHWAAHKLEQLTEHRLTHGEAVAIGVALDTEYSAQAGHLPRESSDRVIGCFATLGLSTWHPSLDDPRLLSGLEEFREHLGGNLCVVLLNAIGDSFETDIIDPMIVRMASARLRDTQSIAADRR